MYILITGGSGFIATHLASRLHELGIKVVLQTRCSSSSCNVPCYKVISKPFHLLTPSDLSDVSHIVHLASAGVSPQMAEWSVLERVNIAGTLHMCQLALALDIPLVISGSSSEYGLSALRVDKLAVDSQLHPLSPYAASKAAACSLAISFARINSLKLAYLRIFNAYGSGQYPKNLWPSLVSAATSGNDFDITYGEQIRDFIPVSSVVDQFINVLSNVPLKKGSPYLANIASGKPLSVRSFCEREWSLYSVGGKLNIGALPYRSSEIMKYLPCLVPKFI